MFRLSAWKRWMREKEASLVVLPDGGMNIITQIRGKQVTAADIIQDYPDCVLGCPTSKKTLPATFVLVPGQTYELTHKAVLTSMEKPGRPSPRGSGDSRRAARRAEQDAFSHYHTAAPRQHHAEEWQGGDDAAPELMYDLSNAMGGVRRSLSWSQADVEMFRAFVRQQQDSGAEYSNEQYHAARDAHHQQQAQQQAQESVKMVLSPREPQQPSGPRRSKDSLFSGHAQGSMVMLNFGSMQAGGMNGRSAAHYRSGSGQASFGSSGLVSDGSSSSMGSC